MMLSSPHGSSCPHLIFRTLGGLKGSEVGRTESVLPGAGQSGLGAQPPLGHQRCRCCPGLQPKCSRHEHNPGKRRREGKRMGWGYLVKRAQKMGRGTPSNGPPCKQGRSKPKGSFVLGPSGHGSTPKPGCSSTFSVPHCQDSWAGLGGKTAAPHSCYLLST